MRILSATNMKALGALVTALLIPVVTAAPHGRCEVGQVWRDSHDCHGFFECAAGEIPVRKVCGPGTAFSPHLGVCDYEWKVPSCYPSSNEWNNYGPGEDGDEHVKGDKNQGEEGDKDQGEEGDKTFAPKENDVPVGQVITSCVEPNTIALTFDDGPSEYTEHFLDLLRDYGARATFFVLGEASQEHPEILHRIQDEHHQIGSHTFDHPSLPTLSHDAVVEQMTRLEDVFISIIEEVPTYMRPPYFDVSDEVLATMRDLGYKVITASIDTKDYEHDDEIAIDVSYDKFLNELDAGGSIVLSHDTYYWTGYSLLERMLIEISERGLTATTVGDCLGEPLDAWYRPA